MLLSSDAVYPEVLYIYLNTNLSRTVVVANTMAMRKKVALRSAPLLLGQT